MFPVWSIEEYLLAPSRVKETEVVDVACYLFGEDFASPSEVKRAVQQYVRPAAVDSQQAAAEDHAYHLVLSDTFAWTHNLSEEEPPGYLPLGLLVVRCVGWFCCWFVGSMRIKPGKDRACSKIHVSIAQWN